MFIIIIVVVTFKHSFGNNKPLLGVPIDSDILSKTVNSEFAVWIGTTLRIRPRLKKINIKSPYKNLGSWPFGQDPYPFKGWRGKKINIFDIYFFFKGSLGKPSIWNDNWKMEISYLKLGGPTTFFVLFMDMYSFIFNI